jgi:DnaJ-class molecular chaperone
MDMDAVTMAYKTLGITLGCGRAIAQKARLDLLKQYHPDKNHDLSSGKVAEINSAWDIIKKHIETCGSDGMAVHDRPHRPCLDDGKWQSNMVLQAQLP